VEGRCRAAGWLGQTPEHCQSALLKRPPLTPEPRSGHEVRGQKATMSVKDRAQVRSVQPDMAHRGAG
jgi:hypothetical protein